MLILILFAFAGDSLYILQDDTENTWTDNKVRVLATVCLLWRQWIKALVWYDDVEISSFLSCVVVDLFQFFFPMSSITICVCFL
jgi:hypothetical protein